MHTLNHLQNLYIHIPFCSGKCTYCGFYSERFSPPLVDNFLDALEREFSAFSTGGRPAPRSVYVGGGTPSLLSPKQWERLCDLIRRHADLGELTEWTVEANPGTVSDKLISIWLENGITRISLGVQSMCDSTLARMQRRHSAADTIKTVTRLNQRGINRIGLDLIACLPDVSMSEWRDTLCAVTTLHPSHISVYACSMEPRSQLFDLWQNGLYAPAGTDAEFEALEAAADLLNGCGYEQYEISNFALPGAQCLYNLNVWRGEDYQGFGPAAASRVGLNRWTNADDLAAYCAPWPDGRPPCETETLSPESDAAERLMFNFRLSSSFSLDEFAAQHGPAAVQMVPFWQKQLAVLADNGLIVPREHGWICTPLGRRMADAIAEMLLP